MGQQLWRSNALVAAVVALTVSCGGAAAVHAAKISADQVEGRWTSEEGTSLVFQEDHTFAAEHFDWLPVASDCKEPSVLSSGRWAFFAPTESSQFNAADESATRGTVVSLIFSAGDCEVDVYLFGDEEDPVLCPTGDPDVGCPSDSYLERSQAAASGS
ncbi:hypothetical protein ACFV2S_05435 [Streptomyces sp. NPDC059695]|uniref:hypothetical protein n=1 Tax=Streptomyces sp. NPDC059695 TaxID=3346910 RepID=UPI00367B7D4F